MQHRTITYRCFPAFVSAVILLAAGCKAVKPYQRAYLNDENMQVGKLPSEQFSGNMHTYREGASGGGGGKNNGGCGCN